MNPTYKESLAKFSADRDAAIAADDRAAQSEAEANYNGILECMAYDRREAAHKARKTAERNAFDAGAEMARKADVSYCEGITKIAKSLRGQYEAGFRSVFA
jgi:hypothetical protein